MVAGRGIFDAIGGGWLCIGNTRRFIVKSSGAARLSVQPLVEETSLNNTMQLSDLLKDSAYKLTQFKPAQIAALEASITVKTSGKVPTPYVDCLVRGKSIKLTPEETVRASNTAVAVAGLRGSLAFFGLTLGRGSHCTCRPAGSARRAQHSGRRGSQAVCRRAGQFGAVL